MPLTLAIRDTLLEFIHIPVWWYSAGLKLQTKALGHSIVELDYLSGFSVWLSHIFVPMYGQRDWKGRILSFLVRLFQVVVRGLFLAVLVSIRIILYFVYLAAPIFVVLGFMQAWRI